MIWTLFNSKFRFISRTLIVDIFLMATLSLIPLLWIPKGQILTGHDSGYPINVLEAYKNRFFTWNSQDSFGVDNTTSISVIPILSIQAAARAIGLSVADSEKVTFIFWFFVMQIAMYCLAKSIKDDIPYRWFPLLSAVLYVFNYYLLALWRYAAATTFSAYTVLPLSIMVLLGVCRGKYPAFRFGIYWAILLFIFNGGGGLSIPLFGGLLLAVTLACMYFVLIEKKERRKELILRVMIFVGVALGFSLLLNAYWILPFGYYVITTYYSTLAAVGGKAVVLKWTDSVSIYTSIAHLFRLQGFPDWYNNPYHTYANQILTKTPFIFLSMLFAPLAFLTLLISKTIEQKKLVYYFVLLSLFGVFFAAGSHPPTGWLYSLFILYVPGFVVFRSAQYKFIPALLVAFAILISYTINYFISSTIDTRVSNPKFKRFVYAMCIGIVCVVVFIYHYPFFGRGFFFYTKSLSTLITVPAYVESYDRWSSTNFDDEGRTLVLPRFNSTWKAALFNWNYFSLYSPFNLITPKSFVQHSYYLNEGQFTLFNRLADDMSTNGVLVDQISSLFGIRHVLLAQDVSYKSDDMPSEAPSLYTRVLGSLRFPLVWQGGQWSVYQNPTYVKQKIYALPSVTAFEGSPKDIVAPLLARSNNFMLSEIIGKSTRNPEFSTLPLQNRIIALPCMSCAFHEMPPEILPQYTNVLPGSIFYPIKRWKERRASGSGSQSSLSRISSDLGFTLKRLAEIQSLIQQGKYGNVTDVTVLEIKTLWNNIFAQMTQDRGVLIDSEVVSKVSAYVTAEQAYIRKITLSHGNVAENILKPIEDILGKMRIYLDEYVSPYANTMSYRVTQSVQNGIMFMDASALPHNAQGQPILPITIRVGEVIRSVTQTIQNGRIDLGVFSLKQDDVIYVEFPQLLSLFSESQSAPVTIDSIARSCQVASVSGYSWQNRYIIELSNVRSLSPNAQIFLRRQKNNQSENKSTDSPMLPHFAFNFDRESLLTQHLYFSGTDGDTGASIYLCVPKGDIEVPLAQVLSVTNERKPSIYISENEVQAAPIEDVKYTRIDQTKYLVDLSRATFPMILVFNENYNPAWRLSRRDTSGTFWKTLTSWNSQGVDTKSHMEIFGYANAWYLREKPADQLILEFYPQTLFYKGLLVSGVGIGIVILFLMRIYRRKN
ncbi:hypothetical protein KBC80_03195 [Candidatus Woesebacteria bacterium]|nr:hypothetical protein [Candidatus Woesebacteria bacterium]